MGAERMTTKDADGVVAAASLLKCPCTGTSPAALPSQDHTDRVQSTAEILLFKDRMTII